MGLTSPLLSYLHTYISVEVRDTRYFHRFGEMSIGREVGSKQMSFAQLKEDGLAVEPSEYRDSNKVASLLGKSREWNGSKRREGGKPCRETIDS